MFIDRKIYLFFGIVTILLALFVTTAKAIAAFCSVALILLAIFIIWHERHLPRTLITYIYTTSLYIIAISLALWLGNLEVAFVFSGKKLILFFGLAIAVGLRNESYRLLSLFSFVIGVLILSIITIYQSFIIDFSLHRASDYMNAVHAGYLMSYGVIVTLVLLLNFRKYLISGTIILSLILSALILNQTRGAWLATLAAMLPLLWKSKKRYMLSALISFFIVSLFFIPGVRERTFNDLKAIQNYKAHSDIETSLGAKIQMWAVSLEMFKKHPLLGIGSGNWQKYTHQMIDGEKAPATLERFNQPHNTFINALATTGILGLIATIALIIYPLFLAIKRTYSSLFYPLLIKLVSIAFIVQGMTDSVTQMHRPFHSYLLIMGVCIAGLVWGSPNNTLNTTD